MRKPWSSTAGRKGFSLLIVIWGLGAIALLVLSFLTTGRLRLQTAFNIAGAAQAQSVAAAATDLAILSLATERIAPNPEAPPVHDGSPYFCALDDAAVAIAIEDESGKVDLNAASAPLLQDMLVGLLAMSPAQAAEIAHGVETFRKPPESDLPPPPPGDKPFGPKRAPFQTALELDQVAGVDNAAFKALLPFVTVNSRAEGIDTHVAPPALLAALLGLPPQDVAALAAAPFPNRLNRDDPRFPDVYRQTGTHGAFLIHVETMLSNGPSAARDSLVDMQAKDGAPFAVHEIRPGVPRALDSLRGLRDAANALAPC